jgi:hypothetical protein
LEGKTGIERDLQRTHANHQHHVTIINIIVVKITPTATPIQNPLQKSLFKSLGDCVGSVVDTELVSSSEERINSVVVGI